MLVLLFIKYYNKKENGQNVSAIVTKNIVPDIEKKQISRSQILVPS